MSDDDHMPYNQGQQTLLYTNRPQGVEYNIGPATGTDGLMRHTQVTHRSGFTEVSLESPGAPAVVPGPVDERGIQLQGLELLWHRMSSKFHFSWMQLVVAGMTALIVFLVYLLVAGVDVNATVKGMLMAGTIKSDSYLASELLEKESRLGVSGHRAFVIPDDVLDNLHEFASPLNMVNMTDALLQDVALQRVLLTASHIMEKYDEDCIVPGVFMQTAYNILMLRGGVTYYNVNITGYAGSDLRMFECESITGKTKRFVSLHSKVQFSHRGGDETVTEEETAFCIQTYYDIDSK